ncbi:MAG TPA: hypothetical protein VFW75_17655 [Acetobacteraceae bacterium]|nr:hypothetical protein [Acetobacteraceae bacterium]
MPIRLAERKQFVRRSAATPASCATPTNTWTYHRSLGRPHARDQDTYWARSFGLALAPHFMTPLHVHIRAALPRHVPRILTPFMDHLLTHTLTVKDGMPLVPRRGFIEQAWGSYRIT